MANKNITMKQYTGSGTNYDTLYPATTAEQASYSNTTTHSTATTVQGVIDELFTSVSNGKTSLASAITDKGQSTSSTDSFATMSEHIAAIRTFKPEQSKTATENGITVVPDEGMALSSVNVAVPAYEGSIVLSFNETSWTYIKSAATSGAASSYWKVGDRKEVKLNGTVGIKSFSNTITYCYILGFDHNTSIESNGEHTIHIGFGASALNDGAYIAYVDSRYESRGSTSCFNMNTSNTNSGGWNSCQMKSTICPAFKNALPSDLQNNIRAIIKWQNDGNSTSGQSSSNEIWLLSEMEVYGLAKLSNYTANQVQYDFYKGVTDWSAAPKIKYKDTSTSTAVIWWERSASSSVSGYFCFVNAFGNADYNSADFGYGFAPCLCL